MYRTLTGRLGIHLPQGSDWINNYQFDSGDHRLINYTKIILINKVLILILIINVFTFEIKEVYGDITSAVDSTWTLDCCSNLLLKDSLIESTSSWMPSGLRTRKLEYLEANCGKKLEPTIFHIYNKGLLKKLMNFGSKSKTKHLDIKIKVLREKLKNNDIAVNLISSNDMLADCLTKAAPLSSIRKLQDSCLKGFIFVPTTQKPNPFSLRMNSIKSSTPTSSFLSSLALSRVIKIPQDLKTSRPPVQVNPLARINCILSTIISQKSVLLQSSLPQITSIVCRVFFFSFCFSLFFPFPLLFLFLSAKSLSSNSVSFFSSFTLQILFLPEYLSPFLLSSSWLLVCSFCDFYFLFSVHLVFSLTLLIIQSCFSLLEINTFLFK
ncbi:hypothetical protein VP01_236g3 [Puccinia sorghi]|uniref:Uncharacterized protein n=1 Tax=Puccinia sorghi TaxID=27349 RepID=A0A0L6V712_9BASI|nr:hypothetical protein VP01_236g3 [Puccinia sorghi]